ncbi:hypothetical protein HJFPF1_01719 [Paramyrothecium foliicola]|nr:hypothetical protein HJFPF1_01719 [Paramyrothecium foliicola]
MLPKEARVQSTQKGIQSRAEDAQGAAKVVLRTATRLLWPALGRRSTTFNHDNKRHSRGLGANE